MAIPMFPEFGPDLPIVHPARRVEDVIAGAATEWVIVGDEESTGARPVGAVSLDALSLLPGSMTMRELASSAPPDDVTFEFVERDVVGPAGSDELAATIARRLVERARDRNAHGVFLPMPAWPTDPGEPPLPPPDRSSSA